MEGNLQTFEPLFTEINPVTEGEAAQVLSLPAGLIRLRETGREARTAFLAAGLLAVLSLLLSLVLFLGIGKEADVVWQEEFQSVLRVLVEGP